MIANKSGNALIAALIFFITLYSQVGFGQNEGKPENKYVLFNNNFSLGYTFGLNSTSFIADEGDAAPDKIPGLLREIELNYTFMLKKNLSLSINGGLGFFPFVYGIGEKGDPDSPYFISYLNRTQYNSYFSLQPTVKYNYWFKKNWHLSGGVGFGIRTYSSENSYSLGQFGNSWWGFNYSYGTRPNYYSQLEVGIDRLLKNQDMIGLSMGYSYSFNTVFSGEYEYNVNSIKSEGTMLNKGHFPSLSLNYTFTRARKMAYIEETFKKEDNSFVEAKKMYKKERRYVDPKSIFIGIAGGGTYLLNRASQDDFIKSSYHLGGKASLTFEIGMEPNRFFEANLSRGGYSSGFKVRSPFNIDASTSYLEVYELSAGYGIRLSNKNNFSFVDLSGGVVLAGHTFKNEYLNFLNDEEDDVYNGSGSTISLNTFDEVKSSFFPLLYGKLSRNFRITNFLYFSTSAQYNVGFYPIATKSLSYAILPDVISNDDVLVKLNGTGLHFQFGLKYKFVPKSK